MEWKNKFLRSIVFIAFVMLLASPAWSGLVGGSGYGVHEATMETMVGKSYSGGMDMVYAQIATGSAAAKTRSFLKCEDGDWPVSGWSVQVNMYDYRGNFVDNFADGINPYGTAQYSIFCQAVKVDPTPDGNGDRVIWFSMTGSNADEGDWYAVTVDPDFTGIVSGPTAQFSQAGNWEVEWNPSTATAFYAGKENDAWTEPHAIYIYTGGALQKVVDVGGLSCGFAFDPDGNLYTGTYTDSGPTTQQEVRMYLAEDIQTSISTGIALTATDAENTISIPMPNGVFLGANDLESDPDGNIYLTANGGWDPIYQSDVGYVYRIDAWNPLSPPTTMTQIALGTMDPTDTDWQKQLAYDGSSNLVAGGHYDPTDPNQIGNRIYVDQDFMWGSGGPDVVSGLSADTDGDSDGVPDALDNAYQTINAGQVDTDWDMYGNMCDADLDNDGGVGMTDAGIFRNAYGTSNEHADFDSDGGVGMTDAGIFRIRYGDSAPYY